LLVRYRKGVEWIARRCRARSNNNNRPTSLARRLRELAETAAVVVQSPSACLARADPPPLSGPRNAAI